MRDELVALRCPDCGSLLLKCSPYNRFPVEVRCRKCKKTVLFEELRPPPRAAPLDTKAVLM